MSENEIFKLTQGFIQDKPACSEALKALKSGTEIQVLLDDRLESACFYKDGKAQLESRAAKNPDVEFSVNIEAIRRLADIPGDSLATTGIEIVREVVAGNIKIKVLSSPFNILTNGYLKIIKQAGPDFLEYLATHGLSSITKVISLIKSMRT